MRPCRAYGRLMCRLIEDFLFFEVVIDLGVYVLTPYYYCRCGFSDHDICLHGQLITMTLPTSTFHIPHLFSTAMRASTQYILVRLPSVVLVYCGFVVRAIIAISIFLVSGHLSYRNDFKSSHSNSQLLISEILCGSVIHKLHIMRYDQDCNSHTVMHFDIRHRSSITIPF